MVFYQEIFAVLFYPFDRIAFFRKGAGLYFHSRRFGDNRKKMPQQVPRRGV